MPDAQVIVHEDGHVIAIGDDADQHKVRFGLEVIVRLGLHGYRIDTMDELAAVEAYVDGLTCPTCVLRMPCGCAGEATRTCPHGTPQRLMQIGRSIRRAAN